MAKKNELTYYCLFDPNTGDRLGGYIEGVNKIPENAVKVTKNDFELYAASPNWKYDWDKNEPKYVHPTPPVVTTDDLRKQALEKSEIETANTIVSGFLVNIKATTVRVDSEITDQVNYNTYAAAASIDPEYTCIIRGCILGHYGKTEFLLTGEEIMLVQRECAEHINDARKAGWERKAWINDPKRTFEELQKYLGGDI